MPKDDSFGGYTLDQLAQAIAMVESSGGTDIGPRYEPGFQQRYGPRYLQQDNKLWSALMQQYTPQELFSSYGRHQVMFPVAVELGYRGSPQDLAQDDINRLYFNKKFLRDWKGSGGDLEAALLRYNGGGNRNYPSRVRQHLQGNR